MNLIFCIVILYLQSPLVIDAALRGLYRRTLTNDDGGAGQSLPMRMTRLSSSMVMQSIFAPSATSTFHSSAGVDHGVTYLSEETTDPTAIVRTCPSPQSDYYQSFQHSDLVVACASNSDCNDYTSMDGPPYCCLHPQCICGSANVGATPVVACVVTP